MYAIVKTGGKQYRVERGQTLLVERLAAEQGASVALQPLMYRSEEAVFDSKGLERVKVTAKILDHVRGEKLRIVKFKPKRGYKRRTGHRQELTRIEITDIALGGAKGEGRQTAKPAAARSTKPAAEKPAAAKPAAKPAAARPAKAAAVDGETAQETSKEAAENGA
jgi:large subunit ribosomal protein L21